LVGRGGCRCRADGRDGERARYRRSRYGFVREQWDQQFSVIEFVGFDRVGVRLGREIVEFNRGVGSGGPIGLGF
jgi:hypothetical protein